MKFIFSAIAVLQFGGDRIAGDKYRHRRGFCDSCTKKVFHGIFRKNTCGKQKFSTVCGKVCGKQAKSRGFYEFSTGKTPFFCGKLFWFRWETIAGIVWIEKNNKNEKGSWQPKMHHFMQNRLILPNESGKYPSACPTAKKATRSRFRTTPAWSVVQKGETCLPL